MIRGVKMREIKFRAYSKKENKMIYSRDDIDYFDGDGIEHGAMETIFQDIWGNVELYIHTTNGTDEIELIKDAVIMQYTGLKDKNGKEIYEGDIIITNDYPFMDEGKQSYVAIVEWLFAGFHRTLKCVNKNKRGGSDGINEPLEEGEYFEVIGNIYENPELLKAR